MSNGDELIATEPVATVCPHALQFGDSKRNWRIIQIGSVLDRLFVSLWKVVERANPKAFKLKLCVPKFIKTYRNAFASEGSFKESLEGS